MREDPSWRGGVTEQSQAKVFKGLALLRMGKDYMYLYYMFPPQQLVRVWMSPGEGGHEAGQAGPHGLTFCSILSQISPK